MHIEINKHNIEQWLLKVTHELFNTRFAQFNFLTIFPNACKNCKWNRNSYVPRWVFENMLPYIRICYNANKNKCKLG